MKGKMGKKDNQYNAVGSPAEKEEKNETAEFKKGGRTKHAHGGKVHGKAPKHRMDRKARSAGGRNPYSSAEHDAGGASTDSEGKKDVSGDGAETEIAFKKGGKVKK